MGQFFDAMQKVFFNNGGNVSINRYKHNTVILQQGDIIADNDYKIIWVLHEVLRQMPLSFFVNVDQFDPFLPYIVEFYSHKKNSSVSKVDKEVTMYVKYYIVRRVSYYQEKDAINYPVFLVETLKQSNITDNSRVYKLAQYVENQIESVYVMNGIPASNQLGDVSNISQYTRPIVMRNEKQQNLLTILWYITDGKFELLEQLGCTILQIFTGRGAYLKLVPCANNVTVISSSNSQYVSAFLRDLFDINVFKISSKLVVTRSAETANLSNLLYRPFSQITSQYSLSELCDNTNIGRFIEDKFRGTLVNIFDRIDDKVADISQFSKMGNGSTEIKGKNKYLGTQSYSSDLHYVFCATDSDEAELFKNQHIPYRLIELSQRIPEYWDYALDELCDQEKITLLLMFVSLGLDYILNGENYRDKEVTLLSAPSRKEQLFLDFKEQMLVIGEEDVMTAETTLVDAYNRFCQGVDIETSVNECRNIISAQIPNIEAVGVEKQKKNAAASKRDADMGYSVLGSGSGGKHYTHVKIKASVEEIPAITARIKEKYAVHQPNDEAAMEEFVNRVTKAIGNSLFDVLSQKLPQVNS